MYIYLFPEIRTQQMKKSIMLGRIQSGWAKTKHALHLLLRSLALVCFVCAVCGKAGPEAMRRPGPPKMRAPNVNEETRTTERQPSSSAGNRNCRIEGATCKAGEIPLFIKAVGYLRACSCPTKQGGLQLVGINSSARAATPNLRPACCSCWES